MRYRNRYRSVRNKYRRALFNIYPFIIGFNRQAVHNWWALSIFIPMKCVFILVFALAFAATLPAQTATPPSLIEWHSRYNIEQMSFSGDGNYLISRGDDNSIIVTDLHKRLPVSRIEKQDVELLAVHPEQPFFYTAMKKADSIIVFKRKLPSGKIMHQVSLPVAIKDGCSMGRNAWFDVDPITDRFHAVYTCDATAVVSVWDSNGNAIEQISIREAVNARRVIRYNNNLWMLCTDGLYEIKDGKAARLVAVNEKEEYFANIQCRGDVAVILSNKYITWYGISKKIVIQRTAVNDFFSQSATDSRARIVQVRHPFVVDRSGAAWVVNTMMDFTEGPLKIKPYALARITDEITYPLQSASITTDTRKAIEPLIAYNARTGLFAIMARSGRSLEFATEQTGYLFDMERKNLSISKVRFTATPGKILLGADDHLKPAYLLNLANGRMETVIALNDRYYNDQQQKNRYKDYIPQNAGEAVYIPDVNGYYAAPYLVKDKEVALSYPFDNWPFIQLPDNSILFVNQEGVLQQVNTDVKVVRQLPLFFLKDEERDYVQNNEYHNGKYTRVNWNANHYVRNYQYDSVSGIAVLYVEERYSNNNTVVHIIDTKQLQLIKSYVADKLTVLPRHEAVINSHGIYSIKNNKAIASFDWNYASCEHFTADPTEKSVYFIINGFSAKDRLMCWDFATSQLYQLGEQFGIRNISCDPHSDLVYTVGLEESIGIWNGATRQPVATLVVSGNKECKGLADFDASYLVLLNNGFYMGENKYYRMLALQNDSMAYSINEIDALYHRPDKVLQSLGYANPAYLQPLAAIAEKRAARSNLQVINSDIRFTDLSQLPFYTEKRKISLNATLPASLGSIKGVQCYINGSAIWTAPQPVNGKTNFSTDVELVDEINHIRLSLVNSNGKETPGDYVYVSSKAATDAEIYVIGMGVSQYKDTTYNLRYAEKDMNDLLNYFYTTDTYQQNHIKRFNSRQVNRTVVDSIRSILKNARSQDVVLCYYAGHGLLDKNNDYYLGTYDIDFQQPAAAGMDIRKLNDAVAASAARKKMIFIDACHSGLIDDMGTASDTLTADANGVVRRGITIKNPNKASAVQYQFNHFNQGTGVDILAASAGNEYALELGDIRNGIFTWSALQAMKSGEADVNNDKKLTLYELQQYVSNTTRQLSKGAQRPTFRQNNLYQDIVLFNSGDSYTGRFMNAAKFNDVQTLKLLLANNEVTVDRFDKDGFTALHYACREGSFAAMKFLLEKGASVSIKARSAVQSTPLYLAAWNGHYRMAYFLLMKGASAENDIQEWQRTEIMKKKDAKINNVIGNFSNLKQQQQQLNAAAMALIKGDTLLADSLITAHGLGMNDHLLMEGLSLVMMPVLGKQYEALEWMVQKGGDVNARSLDDNFTPLMFAANLGQKEMVLFLLNHKADKTARDRYGNTAAMYAAAAGFKDIEAMLK